MITAGARATITIEVSHLGGWGEECQIAQVYKQAAEGARGKIGNLIHSHPDIKIIGEVNVTAIFTETKR